MRDINTYSSETIEESRAVARELAGILKPADIVLLEGNLGSGKTFLVKEICKLWGTDEEATSPSFAIIQIYSGAISVNHFDFYRIEHISELDNLGWEELLNTDAVSFIEWPQMIENQLDDYYKITIELSGEHRVFKLSHS
ncbi:MAG: tRNA (adenosine(37)-N6)-threonylcarbamoyltransferase complex ATPase subunit type 1 TsaE [Calditrichaceae bacterium]